MSIRGLEHNRRFGPGNTEGHDRGESAPDVSGRLVPWREVQYVVAWILVVVSVVAWRTDVYYSGGLDKIVVLKSLVGGAALALAAHLFLSAGRRSSIGPRTPVIVGAYLMVTVIGGWAAGSLVSSGVLAVRVGIVGVTVALLVMSTNSWVVLRSLAAALSIVALACCVTTLPGALSGARLGGSLLPLNANQLAMMFGVPLVLVSWRAISRAVTAAHVASGAALLGLIWLTGSRTGLAAALLAMAIVILLAERVPIAGFVCVVLAVPAVVAVATTSNVLAQFVDRSGTTGNLGNLSSRTIAWQAAFSVPKDFWQELFGRGLSAKTVSVAGTYWDTQVLDSSWVSAYFQGGWVGLVLLALWSVMTLVGVTQVRQPARGLWVAMCVFCLLWGVTASGLLDAYVLFALMVTTSFASEPSMRVWAGEIPSAPWENRHQEGDPENTGGQDG